MKITKILLLAAMLLGALSMSAEEVATIATEAATEPLMPEKAAAASVATTPNVEKPKLFHVYGGVEAGSSMNYGTKTGLGMGFEYIGPKRLIAGVHDHLLIGINPYTGMLFNNQFMTFPIDCARFNNQLDLYAGYDFLPNPRHNLSLVGGLALASNVLEVDDPTTNSFVVRKCVPGLMARLSYHYEFQKGITLGAFIQYTYNFKKTLHNPTMLGITVGYRF